MLKRILFGPWEPDKAPHGSEAVTVARNVTSHPNGYRPVRSFETLTASTPETFGGGAAYVGSDGTSALVVGTANKLLRYSGGTWVTVLTALSVDRWRFAQFGDLAVAVNGGTPKRYNLLTGAAADLAGSPPVSTLVTTVRDFVVVAGNPAARQRVTWSGFNNAENWTAGVNQSGSQDMHEGGEITGLAGGEYGLVFQRHSVKRLSYVGAPIVFQVDEIARDVGCMVAGSLAQWGRLIFFLSERGFMVCDGNEVRPIGDEKVDTTFFRLYAREDLKRLYAAVDPRQSLVIWLMPGTPGTAWAYNWNSGRWTDWSLNAQALFTGFTASTSIDELDATYGNLDAIPGSLDSARFAGGDPILMVVDNANVIGALSGSPMEAKVETAATELAPGRRSRVRRMQAITDAARVTVSLTGRQRLQDQPAERRSADVRASGHAAISGNARFMAFGATIPAGEPWTYLQSVDVEAEPGARR